MLGAMALEMFFPNSTPEQREQALAAALAVFEANRIAPEVAAVARMEMELFTARGRRGPMPHPEAPKAAIVFLDAQNAAVDACAALGDALCRGHIHVAIEDDSAAGRYLRESCVIKWVDAERRSTSN